jgi:hypothetical protein
VLMAPPGDSLYSLRDLAAFCDLSSAMLAVFSEAAAVLLNTFHPAPPPPTAVRMTSGLEEGRIEIDWDSPDVKTQETHANEKDATEFAAYGISVLAAQHRGFRIRKRAHNRSGADFLMVRHGEPDNDFVKLEVSGVARGEATLLPRSKAKVAQVRGGNLARPGCAVVVGFESARILMEFTS